jgi:hypothetical protein
MAVFGALLGTAGTSRTAIGNSNVMTCNIPVVMGDLVFSVFAQSTTLSVTGVTDNLGHTYTPTNAGTDAGGVTGRAFYGRITANGTLTSLTGAAVSSANAMSFIAAAFSGPFDAPPADVNIANQTTDTVSAFVCPTTGTLTQAIELVTAWGAANYAVAWVANAPNLLAIDILNGVVLKAAIGYQVSTSTVSLAPAFSAGSNPTQIVLGTTSFKLTRLMGQGIY